MSPALPPLTPPHQTLPLSPSLIPYISFVPATRAFCDTLIEVRGLISACYSKVYPSFHVNGYIGRYAELHAQSPRIYAELKVRLTGRLRRCVGGQAVKYGTVTETGAVSR
ncbi:hypothetical protein BaRGS_00005866 [Batillaria attramentaria]|uniref:Uncharacterized protein n=1 Tax=Batillaria attramentaria TaxID=370345 RepID=A0ABD0LVD9_9CAEN